MSHINASGVISNKPLSGSVWLEAPKNLDLNNNLIKVYRDKVQNLDAYSQLPLTFSFPSTATISGSGNVSVSDYFCGLPIIQSGNVRVDGIVNCLECGYDVTLNLIGLSYDNNGESTVYWDDRASLMAYHEYLYLDGASFSQTESLNVQPVPLPSSLEMFSSAILLLLFRVRSLKRMLKKLN